VLDRIERETGKRLSPRRLLLDSLQQVADQLSPAAAAAEQAPALEPASTEPPAARDRSFLRRLGRLLPGGAV
jgi:hypothetical protein